MSFLHTRSGLQTKTHGTGRLLEAHRHRMLRTYEELKKRVPGTVQLIGCRVVASITFSTQYSTKVVVYSSLQHLTIYLISHINHFPHLISNKFLELNHCNTENESTNRINFVYHPIIHHRLSFLCRLK